MPTVNPDAQPSANTDEVRAVFASFDFSRQPATTPLDQVLHELLAPCLGNEPGPDAAGCLALLPVQTGLGKTHSSLGLLIEQMLAQVQRRLEDPSAAARRLVYITDSIDNTRHAHDKLRELIDAQVVDGLPRFSAEQRAWLKEQVLYLPSQANQLESCSDELVHELVECFAGADRKLLAQWAEFLRLSRMARERRELASALRDSLQERAQAIHKALLQAIQLRLRERQQAGQPLTSSREQTLLDHFLPAERLRRGEAHVLFMTTSKYLHGCDHALGKYQPLLELQGQLLLIDEIDRQSGEILKLLVRRKAVDLIEVMRTLHANLGVHHLDNGPLYRDIARRFDELAADLRTFAEEWHLDCAYDVENLEELQGPLSLFSDRSYTHVHSLKHAFSRLQHDEERQKNLIQVLERADGELLPLDEDAFSRFLNGADQLFQRFIRLMEVAVYQRQANARHSEAEGARERYLDSQRQQVIGSILSHYNLRGLIEPVREALASHALSPTRQTQAREQRSYHGRGFKFIEVRRHADSQDTVAAQLSGLRCSPSGWLAELVEGGAVVLGLSATAEAQTVVHNFDLHYLAQRLGSALRRVDGAQRQRLHEHYQQRRDYADRVRLEVAFHSADEVWLYDQLLLWRRMRNPGLELDRLLGGEEDCTYQRQQLSKLLLALQRFAASPDNRYLLVLRNSFRSLQNDELRAFVEDCLQRWSPARRVRVFHEVNAGALRADVYDQVLEVLHHTLDKVVVFSSYNTMGTGKNPDYRVGQPADRETLVWVGTGEADFRAADIDALYLEKPTHLLPGDETAPDSERLIRLHCTLALQERDELSVREARHWIRRLLRNDTRQLLGDYYQTRDYPAAVWRIVEQAVGRTARTACKRRQILLLADAELRELLAADDRDPRLLSHEYLALRERAGTPSTQQRAALQERRCLNLAVRHTENSRQYIRSLLKHLYQGDEATIAAWEGLRRQVLTQPALAAEPVEQALLYLQLPGESAEGYAFSGNPEHAVADLCFFSGLKRPREVSARAAGLPLLMANRQVREHFIANDFACHWPASPWLLNPLVFQAIYQGAVGEQAARAVLEAQGLQWQPLPAEHYERFDALVEYRGQRVLLDVKHWRGAQDSEAQELEAWTAKIRRVGAALGVRKVIYLRVLGPAGQSVRFCDEQFRGCPPEQATVMDWPALLDERTGQLLEDNLIEFLTWLEANA